MGADPFSFNPPLTVQAFGRRKQRLEPSPEAAEPEGETQVRHNKHSQEVEQRKQPLLRGKRLEGWHRVGKLPSPFEHARAICKKMIILPASSLYRLRSLGLTLSSLGSGGGRSCRAAAEPGPPPRGSGGTARRWRSGGRGWA